MSLINDALKRASQTEKNRPRDPDATPLAALQAVNTPRRSMLPVVIGVCVVALLATAGVLVWYFFSRASASFQEPTLAPMVARPVSPASAPKVEPAPAATPAPVPQPVVVAPPTQPAPAPQPVVVAPTPPPAPFPDLKLQGIFYNAKNPRAAINGQVKREHEQVGDVTIVKISQTSVTVEWNGQTKDLYLNGQ
jgi:hypothetical protein